MLLGGARPLPSISLAEVFSRGASSNPDGVALRESERQITYAELDAFVERLACALLELGMSAGDRLALWMPKSIAAVAVMQAAVRVGVVYVPIDPLSPPARVRQLLADCVPAACATLHGWIEDRLGEDFADLPTIAFGDSGEAWELLRANAASGAGQAGDGDELAYILYTSGSTGRPKGVCISHRNALAFIEWAHAEIAPAATDRFSSHAPFHFDLSVLDLYVAFLAGASVCLIPEGLAFMAPRLVDFIRETEITVWYSVPSALMLMESAGLLEGEPTSLRAIVFAGEPYPIASLRRLRRALPSVRLLNFYGPTETNVCTFFDVGEVPDQQNDEVPIGRACSGDDVWAEAADGRRVAVGGRGELVVEGPTVMLGYWGGPAQQGAYRTGDIVERVDDRNFRYRGRRDSMVKARGHRVELSDVESTIVLHKAIREAAVVLSGSGPDARLVALIVLEPDEDMPLLELKRHCAERLPRYMIVHQCRVIDALPRTGNGKIDRASLGRLAGEGGPA
jgi:L-proline---[L-prolyl-carrier protein] ligase